METNEVIERLSVASRANHPAVDRKRLIAVECVCDDTDQSLFISSRGRRLGANYVSNLVRKYMTSIGIEFRGACHLLRHTAATLMMENGADLRSLQEYLGQ